MLQRAKDCFGELSKHKPINGGLVGPLEGRSEAVKQYKKSKNKWKNDMKALNKQNKILYSIAKKSGSRRELKNIKNINAKYSKKRCDSSSKYSSN